MAQFEQKPSKQQQQKDKQINWNEFNYPPLLKLIHFRPSELPKNKKSLVMIAFIIHLVVLANTFLSIIDNCILGGINILYSFLFFFIFNPIVMFMFYRCYIGLCKERSKLSLFTYIQPLVIVVEIVVAIVDFIGFNGFVKVASLYKQGGKAFPATLALMISIIYLAVALLSCYLYFLVFKKKSLIAKALI